MEKSREEMIINFGSFGYDVPKMSSILGEDVKSLMADTNSDFYKLYQKGADLADYSIDSKLFELARNGDIKALDKLEIRKEFRKDKKR